MIIYYIDIKDFIPIFVIKYRNDLFVLNSMGYERYFSFKHVILHTYKFVRKSQIII